MCRYCHWLRQTELHRPVRVSWKSPWPTASDAPLKPRALLYGLFSDPFDLFGQRYCWVVENGVLTLQKVTWAEEE